MVVPGAIDDVLSFWMSEPARWWKKDAAFDEQIRGRFLALHDAINRGEHESWLDTPRGALAYVIALDQFSRNMFRESPRAFASDPRARAATKRALERGDDRALPADERVFLYMPLMHSEDLADQERSVERFGALGAADQLRFAQLHRDIVHRFGRFPHRNGPLGRTSTPEEIEFLKGPGSSF